MTSKDRALWSQHEQNHHQLAVVGERNKGSCHCLPRLLLGAPPTTIVLIAQATRQTQYTKAEKTMPQTTPPMSDDEFVARAMDACQWTYPLELISLGIVDYIWPVLDDWGQQAADKWRQWRDKIKEWFTPARRTYNNQSDFLTALWTAADWAADECGINDWRAEWPSAPGVGA